MIEFLALAAEVTAVLLIISIAYPGRSVSVDKDSKSNLLGNQAIETLQAIQEPIQAIKLLVFQAASQQYSRHLTASDWLKSDSHREITESLSQLMTLVLEKDEDPATRLPTMESMRGFFNSTYPLKQRDETSVQIATLTVDHWSDLVNQHGQVVAELLLRELAKQFVDKFSPHGMVIRYTEYAFAVGFVGLPTPKAVELLHAVRQSVFENMIAIGEHEISSSLSIAITEISNDDFNQENQVSDSVWERLEEATAQSITSGGNQIHGCTDIHGSVESKTDLSSPSTVTEIVSDANGHVATIDENPIKETEVAKPEQEKVASSDDIAALFASQKSKAKLTEADPPLVIPAKSDAADLVTEGSASVDDIASLFATMKKPAAKKEADVPASKSDSIAATIDKNPIKETEVAKPDQEKVASSDDIAALFASQKPKPKPKLTEADPPLVIPAKSDAADLVTEGKASVDDIASLFATIKKPTAKKEAAVPDSKSDSIAISSDIDSLVAVENPKASDSDEVTEESLVATIEDINRLFAEAQKKHASVVENSPTGLPPPASVAAVAEPKSATKGVVNADDIEALFAAMKK